MKKRIIITKNKSKVKKLFCVIVLVLLVIPIAASAHQPRIPQGDRIIVTNPEISKAYYVQLKGQPQVYLINSDKPFALYVNILVPDISGQKTDVLAQVVKLGIPVAPSLTPTEANLPIQLVLLDGPNSTWKKFFEPFGRDNYLMGPEYRASVSAGQYQIKVYSTNNDSKYSLAIGETESFDLQESWNAVNLIPQIKRDFFNESPVGFILSPFGIGYTVFLFILSMIFGLLYRLLMRKYAHGARAIGRNIGRKDKLFRLVLGIIILLIAIFTTWNPILLFVSGFCLFEAIFSWCGVYAALGKNTCPIK